MVEKAKEEVENTIKEEGERAVLETGVNNLHPDLVKLIGKLRMSPEEAASKLLYKYRSLF